MKQFYKTTFVLASLLFTQSLAAVNCDTNPLPNAKYLDGFCGFSVDTNGLKGARGIDTAANKDIIVLDRSNNYIYAYWEEEDGFKRATLFSGGIGLNHAVRYFGGFIWASTSTTVFRWPYNYRGSLGEPQSVITGMPEGGSHNTRSMEFDNQGRIYVNIGSGTNIDPAPTRAFIIRTSYQGTLPVDYDDVEIFANGTRNECGLRFNPVTGDLWGAENSLEFDTDDFKDENNPADEINIFSEANKGKFYGYPYCYSEGYLVDGSAALQSGSLGAGSQHAVNPSEGPSDEWCRDTNNVVPPAFPIRAHEAPLDLYFYTGSTFSGFTNQVYLTANHGSANRSIQVYQLNQDGSPNKDILSTRRLVQGASGTWQVAPVAMTVAPCRSYGECLYFTDDTEAGGLRAIALRSSAGSPFNASTTSTSTSTSAQDNIDTSSPQVRTTFSSASYLSALSCFVVFAALLI